MFAFNLTRAMLSSSKCCGAIAKVGCAVMRAVRASSKNADTFRQQRGPLQRRSGRSQTTLITPPITKTVAHQNHIFGHSWTKMNSQPIHGPIHQRAHAMGPQHQISLDRRQETMEGLTLQPSFRDAPRQEENNSNGIRKKPDQGRTGSTFNGISSE